MTPDAVTKFLLRRYRRKLLKKLDGPFDQGVSLQLDAVDALLSGL